MSSDSRALRAAFLTATVRQDLNAIQHGFLVSRSGVAPHAVSCQQGGLFPTAATTSQEIA